MEELLLSKNECNTLWCTLSDQERRYESDLEKATDPEDIEFITVELEKTKLLRIKFEKYA